MANIINLSLQKLLYIIFAGFLIGFSKTGISSFMMPVIPIIAAIFGGRESTGIVLPMLIVGDIIAIKYYNRHANWGDIKKLLPWTLIGLIIAAVFGDYINENQFKVVLCGTVILCLAILIYFEYKKQNVNIPKNEFLYSITGVVCGFTSMIGNAAGPIFSVYLLAKGFKKNNFMGTTAWFFFIVNLIKVPIQIIFWNNITIKSGITTLIGIPSIIVGAILGVILIKKLDEGLFHKIILIVTGLAAIKLLI